MASAQLNIGQLDSWKEIAAYFRRDKRTVRRWEKERGLPVHRYPGGERGRVYANIDELEGWFRGVDVTALDEAAESVSDSQPAPALFQIPAVKAEEVALEESELNSEIGFTHSGFRAASERPFLRSLATAGIASLFLMLGLASANPLWHLLHSVQAKQPDPPLSATSSQPLPVHRTVALNHKPDPQAVELYLKGRYYWNKRTSDDLKKALDFFTQAVVRDPNYAAAYAGLADCYLLMRQYSTMPDAEAYDRAGAAAQRAIEIDDSLSEGHRALAFSAFFGKWDVALADREFRRAIDLNPDDVEAHHWYASMLESLHRFDAALPEIDRARQLAPMSNSILADRDLFLIQAGHREEGKQGLLLLERSEPGFVSPHRYLARIYLQEKKYREYLDERAAEANLTGNSPFATAIANAKAALTSGGPTAMLESLSTAYKLDPQIAEESHYELARTMMLLGHRDEALEQLRQSAERHDSNIFFASFDPSFKPLLSDPAFLAILKQTGL